MQGKRKEELDAFLGKSAMELLYIYHLSPSSPDGALANVVLEYKKFEANQMQNVLLAKQNRALVLLTRVLAVAAVLQVVVSGLAIFCSG